MSWGRKGDIFCEVAAAARLEFWQWPDFASTLALELWEGEEGRAVRWVYESDRPVPSGSESIARKSRSGHISSVAISKSVSIE